MREGDRLLPLANSQPSRADQTVVFMDNTTFTINAYEQTDAICKGVELTARSRGASIDSTTDRVISLEIVDVIFEQGTGRLSEAHLVYEIEANDGRGWAKSYRTSGSARENPSHGIGWNPSSGLNSVESFQDASTRAIEATVEALLADPEFLAAARSASP